ncbi:hypothetical protein [Pontimicrobium sp. MEBiC06410]
MANKLMFNKNIEILLCENQGRNRFLLFEDSTIKIESKVTYDSQSNIQNMIFSGHNKNGNRYTIKHVTYCKSNNFDWGDRFLIHIDKTGIPDGNISFKIDANYNANLIRKLDFKKNSVTIFFFKEYLLSVPQEQNDLDCTMQMGTPKTKDGAIVVGT